MKIRELRENAGLSQTELASKVGVTQGFISHIELGIREPTLKLVRKLAAALGVSVSDLLDENQPKAVGE
ncbi:MAG: helix-turn-helix domain-containing protein [Firmicutes bacterium]|nr:helix-turn-helix domain-containing protein [Bacillota bacterium]